MAARRWRRRSRPVAEHADRQRDAVNDAPATVVLSNVHGPIAENTSTAVPIKVADIVDYRRRWRHQQSVAVGPRCQSVRDRRHDAVAEGRRPSRLRDQPGPQRQRSTSTIPTVGGPVDAQRLAGDRRRSTSSRPSTARPAANTLIGTNNGETIIRACRQRPHLRQWRQRPHHRRARRRHHDRRRRQRRVRVQLDQRLRHLASPASSTTAASARIWRTRPARHHHRLHARPGQDRPVGDRRQHPGRRQPGLHLARHRQFHGCTRAS